MEADPDIGGRRELTERIAFAHTHNICLRTAREFERRGIGPKDFFSTDAATLCAISGCRPDVFNSARRSADLDRAAKEAEFIERRGIRAIYYTDPDYPRRLLECDDAPAMLYCIGTPVQAAHAVAIVGTRHSTPYGQSMVERLVSGLAEKIDDLVIVSGLAYGIDIAAHRAAMNVYPPSAPTLFTASLIFCEIGAISCSCRRARSWVAVLRNWSTFEARS